MARFGSTQTSMDDAINTLADVQDQHSYNTKSDGAATLTVAEFIGGLMVQSGTPGAFALTFPTAAAIVAALKNARVNQQFDFVYVNGGNGAVTLTTNTGLTLSGNMVVAIGDTQIVRAVVTDVGSGTEAVTIVSLMGAPA